jgi:hypothetical protein
MTEVYSFMFIEYLHKFVEPFFIFRSLYYNIYEL